jgi:hypothetical protein
MERTLHSLMGGMIHYGEPRGFEAGRQILLLHSKATNSVSVSSQAPTVCSDTYGRCIKVGMMLTIMFPFAGNVDI